MMVAKDYESWFPIKKKLNAQAKDKLPSFKQRQIWWAHIGVNIGHEVFGKGSRFKRPVLIIKKYDKFKFLAAPLSLQTPKRPNNVVIVFRDEQSTVLFDQLRTLDARRLRNFYGQLSRQQFEDVITALKREF